MGRLARAAQTFYKERLGTGSPPHPTRLRRPTYGLWWLRLDLTEQSPGLFDPRGEGFGGGNAPSRLRNHASQPAQLGGGPLRALENGPQARQKKGRTPAGSPQTRKGGSREEEPLPPWCSFLRLSSKESRAPARGRAGNGALRPKGSFGATYPKGTQYRPPTKRGIPRRVSPLFIPPLVGWNLSHFLPAR